VRADAARRRAILAALAIALAGCGYSFRGALPGHITTVGVPVFANLTPQPAVENVITTAIIDAFAANSRLAVVRPETADSILEGEVVDYVLQPIAYNQAADVTEYRLVVTLNFRYRDVRRGELLLQEVGFREKADFRSTTVAQNLTLEDGALRQAARDIGRAVVALAVSRF
jgi:outer membrane lipopolysaccharide assembly protein LptE/RlpB